MSNTPPLPGMPGNPINNKPQSIMVAKLPVSEIGKHIIIAKCNNCGNDAFHIKWEQVNIATVRMHGLLCTECKFEIDPNEMSMTPKPR